MDKYDYVMHGKVFKVTAPKSKSADKIEVYASYGGLLMSLKGDARSLQSVELDQRIYFLARKA